ncbi:Uncharacterised protein [uncultured Clostridium sp.]|nr:Uncharacterised protein [uncultured Clostridium sp.]SCJ35990.1 Uncharacterised protein [uncultured Clostridium sp.]
MDLIKDNEFMKKLDDDIESLSKTLYLENPDLWLDFLEKSSDKNFDEMSLYFAAKYNFISIIKYAVEVNEFDLDSTSKNKAFPSVRKHLIDVAHTEKSFDVLSYLTGEKYTEDVEKSSDKTNLENDNKFKSVTNYSGASYSCPHCNLNVFEFGYKVLISSTCYYSPSDRKIVRSNPMELDTIICASCNKEIEDVTPKKLEDILNIENCVNCGSHIPTSGVLKEVSVSFNKDNGKFEDGGSTYCCKPCRKSLEKPQLEYFNLI